MKRPGRYPDGPNEEPFWVEDGQHRSGGLETAEEKYGFDLTACCGTTALRDEQKDEQKAVSAA